MTVLYNVANGNFEGGRVNWGGTDGYITKSLPPGITPFNGQYVVALPDNGEPPPADSPRIWQSLQVPEDAPFLTYWAQVVSSEEFCGRDMGAIRVSQDELVLEADTFDLCTTTSLRRWTRGALDLRPYVNQRVFLEIYSSTGDTTPNSLLLVDFVTFSATP
jgi:hypothetical protein